MSHLDVMQATSLFVAIDVVIVVTVQRCGLIFSLFDCSRISLAVPHDGKHSIKFMHMDLSKARMLTCGGDRIVKVGGTTDNTFEIYSNNLLLEMLGKLLFVCE